MPKVNAAWHRIHRMPPRPTLDQRISWHLAHTRACGCRKVPATVAAEIARRARRPGGARRRSPAR